MLHRKTKGYNSFCLIIDFSSMTTLIKSFLEERFDLTANYGFVKKQHALPLAKKQKISILQKGPSVSKPRLEIDYG